MSKKYDNDSLTSSFASKFQASKCMSFIHYQFKDNSKKLPSMCVVILIRE